MSSKLAVDTLPYYCQHLLALNRTSSNYINLNLNTITKYHLWFLLLDFDTFPDSSPTELSVLTPSQGYKNWYNLLCDAMFPSEWRNLLSVSLGKLRVEPWHDSCPDPMCHLKYKEFKHIHFSTPCSQNIIYKSLNFVLSSSWKAAKITFYLLEI